MNIDINKFKLNKNFQIDLLNSSIKTDEKSIKELFSTDDETCRKLHYLFNIFDTQKEDGSIGKDGVLNGNEIKNLWDMVKEYAGKNQEDESINKNEELDENEANLLLKSILNNSLEKLNNADLNKEDLIKALNLIQNNILKIETELPEEDVLIKDLAKLNAPDFIKTLLQNRYADTEKYEIIYDKKDVGEGIFLYTIKVNQNSPYKNCIYLSYSDDSLVNVTDYDERYIAKQRYVLYPDGNKYPMGDITYDYETFLSDFAQMVNNGVFDEFGNEKKDIANYLKENSDITFSFFDSYVLDIEEYTDSNNCKIFNNESELEKVLTNLLKEYLIAQNYNDLLKAIDNKNLKIDSIVDLYKIAKERTMQNQNNCRQEFKDNANGILFDKNVSQTIGDCWLIESLKSCSRFKAFNNLIKKELTNYDKNDKTYSIKLNGKIYSFTYEEIENAKELSDGDMDVRAFEMAIRNSLIDLGVNDSILTGGYLSKFVFAMCSDSSIVHKTQDINEFLNSYKNGKIICQIARSDSSTRKVVTCINMKTGEENMLLSAHAYELSKIDNEYFYLCEPNDTNVKLKVKKEDFMEFFNDFEYFDINKFVEFIKASNNGEVKRVAYNPYTGESES